MKHSVASAVALLTADPARTAIITDFDGTLARIVEDSAAARPLPGAATLLAELSSRYGRVAVVSGRPAAFLAEHLLTSSPGDGVQLVGLYGLESVGPDGSVLTMPEAESWRSVVQQVAERAVVRLNRADAVERKGLTVTLHWRQRPEERPAVEKLADELSSQTGLAVHPAKMSVELRPPLEVDKGTVVGDLVEGFAVAAFLGDDVGDLPAFAALEGFAGQGVGACLRVAVSSSETPEALLEQADLEVDGPEGAYDFLSRL